MRYHLTPVRIAKINSENTDFGEDVETGEHFARLVRIQTYATTLENSVEVPQFIQRIQKC